MHSDFYLSIGYVALLLLLVIAMHLYLRRHAPLDRGSVLLVIIALAGFVVQAYLCFTDWTFFVQLAFIACVAGEFWFWSASTKKF